MIYLSPLDWLSFFFTANSSRLPWLFIFTPLPDTLHFLYFDSL